jgi:hypothetical protein
VELQRSEERYWVEHTEGLTLGVGVVVSSGADAQVVGGIGAIHCIEMGRHEEEQRHVEEGKDLGERCFLGLKSSLCLEQQGLPETAQVQLERRPGSQCSAHHHW